ncbi:MAG: hypothetical protein HC922_04955 [Leptolyngbyaceae cyanobacterium SM2_3_12]|nr:hypothetical protein [Leptolyngbyaceae cyanobacterium SM2_3_12]
MSLDNPRLAAPELTRRLIDMAKTGVYRQSVFETFRPVATRRQIRDAIAEAKQFGLYSIPSLRDEELGTYYQIDASHYESFQTASKVLGSAQSAPALTEQMILTHQALRAMLRTVAGGAIGLGVLGAWCLWEGQAQVGRTLWLGAAVALGVWGIQRTIARRVL